MPQGMEFERFKHLQHDLNSTLTPEDHVKAAGFLHFCNEWDGLLIDKSDDEFSCCFCSFSKEFDPETGKIVKWLSFPQVPQAQG